MLYVDIPTRDEVRGLLEDRHPASVSLYLPTTPLTQDTDACRIALKNMAREAEQQLVALGTDRRSLQDLLEHIDELVEDDAFWAHQARSLAILGTPDGLQTYRLPNALTPMVVVSDRFHMKPLLRSVAFPQVAYVLALAAGGVRLLEVAPDLPATRVRVEGLPTDAASAVGKSSIKDRSHSQRIHGSEGEKVRLRQYARQVEQALRDLLRGSDVPLILAASETLAALYRSVNTYPNLLAQGLVDSPDTLDDATLVAQARGVLDATYAADIAAWRALFDQRRSQDRAVTDLATAARAAARGAIDSALVDIDVVVPGTMDDVSGEIALAPADEPGHYGIIDEIARRILQTGGRVLAVRKDDIPDGAAIAAILRFPLA
jgi:hypothetical protein